MSAPRLVARALAVPREGEHTDRLLMAAKRIGDLLDRIECLRHPCDLDLLLFFSRHPRAFLLSERLAEYVGYELPQVAQSLETVITAGLLRRSPDPTHPARLYVLTPGSTRGGGGPSPPPNPPNTERPPGPLSPPQKPQNSTAPAGWRA